MKLFVLFVAVLTGTSAAFPQHSAFLVVVPTGSSSHATNGRPRRPRRRPRGSFATTALQDSPNNNNNMNNNINNMNNNNNNNNGRSNQKSSSFGKLPPLTASQQERREEETRRKERSSDVVIGKTSAKTNARDYPIDPKSTQELYLRQASNIEQEIYKQTERGMEFLKTLQLEKASSSFDRVFELKPNAYLWQAGIARFYQNDLQQASDIFARNAATFESKFGEPASEERIWRDACQLKVHSSMDKKKRKETSSMADAARLVAQVPERNNNDMADNGISVATSESRKVLRITKELFEASIERDAGKEVLARAKLRAIAGSADEQPQMDRKMWKLNAWYYLGLHYDVIGDEAESKECMKMALRLCPSSNGNDIVHTLPMLHMARREWFDDEEFDNDGVEEETVKGKRGGGNGQLGKTRKNKSTIPVMDRGTRSDPVVVESIRTSVSKMKYTQLQDALKTRGLKFHASKEELANKLVNSLLEDIGLD
jgi:tetratricopeptide (TPR) repeat protein